MDTQSLYNQALEMYRQGNLAGAEQICLDILSTASADAGAMHMLGALRAQQGRFDEALASFDRMLAAQPESFEANLGRANALYRLNRFDAALTAYDNAVAIRPRHASALNNRGNTKLALGHFEAALVDYDAAIALKPHGAEAHYNRGNALVEMKRDDDAVAAYSRALAIQPNHVSALNNNANVLRRLKRFDEALENYGRALMVTPDNVTSLGNRGDTLNQVRRPDEALTDLDRALAIDPGNPDLLTARGNALACLKRFDEALAAYERALAITPDFAAALGSSGVVIWNMGRLEEALARLDRAVELDPGRAPLWSSRGNALRDLGKLDEALQSYDRAIRLEPDYAEAQWNKSLCLLLMERFAEGWALYSWHRRLPAPVEVRDYPQPYWSGAEDLGGKTVLVFSDLGLGDTLQFCRYLPRMQATGARIIIDARASLRWLLACAFPTVELSGPVPRFDYQVSMIDLPAIFRAGIEPIPAAPYLKGEPARLEGWRAQLGTSGFKVGITWQGHRRAFMGGRAFQLSDMEPLSHVPGVRLISLQKNDGTEQMSGANFPVESLGTAFDNGTDAFIDTASIMECLDLVITPDTALAHLAGALGRPVWIALRHIPDWRWHMGRADSPWYPTARLFRQTMDGDWAPVFAEIARALPDFATPSLTTGRTP
jgi:tetratricopeptide (TPR) repeat protein